MTVTVSCCSSACLCCVYQYRHVLRTVFFFSPSKEGGNLTQRSPRRRIRVPIMRRLGRTASRQSHGVTPSNIRKGWLETSARVEPPKAPRQLGAVHAPSHRYELRPTVCTPSVRVDIRLQLRYFEKHGNSVFRTRAGHMSPWRNFHFKDEGLCADSAVHMAIQTEPN